MSLFFVLFAAGGSFVALALPATTSEPGPLPLMAGLVVVVACSTLVVVLMVSSSRWRSLKLMAALAVSYYAAVTCVL